MQKLKDNDKEIDAGIDAIAASMDRLANVAGQMKDEVSRIGHTFCFITCHDFHEFYL